MCATEAEQDSDTQIRRPSFRLIIWIGKYLFAAVISSFPNRLIAIGLLVATLALGGCAAPGDWHDHAPGDFGRLLSNGRNPAWRLKDLALIQAPRVLLMAEGASLGSVDIASMHSGWTAASRLLDVAGGMSPDIMLIAGRPANAFSSVSNGKPVVAVNFGMAEMLGGDIDAWAAMLGHELAHMSLKHREVRQKRREGSEASSDLLAIALAIAGVPFGSILADASVDLVERGYSRDDERDADRAGVALMVRAGFNPEGAVRLQELLARTGGSASLPFLSTHPGDKERIAAMRELVRQYAIANEAQK